MSSTQVFCSYPRARTDDVTRISGYFEQLGQEVWLDRELSGGQEWWDTILSRIRACGCFVFLVCEEALGSRACRAELDYALATNRTVLPVAVGEPVPDAVLPRSLSRLQRIDAGDPMRLARALVNLPAPAPLPDPLPEPPPVPISYMDELAAVLEEPELGLAQQRDLLGTLRQRLATEEDVPAVLTLLHRLRRRSDLFAGVAVEVDAELARHRPPAEPGIADTPAPQVPSSTPPPPPPPVPWQPSVPQPAPAPRRSSGGKVAALVAVGVLVVGGGIGAAVALSGGDEGAGPGPTTPSPPTSPEVTVDDGSTVPPVPDEPFTYGDDPVLDSLTDDCDGGDLGACDELYFDSPAGSEYEAFGDTCGARVALLFSGGCDAGFVDDFTDDVDSCAAGDMAACDRLYSDSALGSVYEAYGAECGGVSSEPVNGDCALLFST